MWGLTKLSKNKSGPWTQTPTLIFSKSLTQCVGCEIPKITAHCRCTNTAKVSVKGFFSSHFRHKCLRVALTSLSIFGSGTEKLVPAGRITFPWRRPIRARGGGGRHSSGALYWTCVLSLRYAGRGDGSLCVLQDKEAARSCLHTHRILEAWTVLGLLYFFHFHTLEECTDPTCCFNHPFIFGNKDLTSIKPKSVDSTDSGSGRIKPQTRTLDSNTPGVHNEPQLRVQRRDARWSLGRGQFCVPAAPVQGFPERETAPVVQRLSTAGAIR